MFSNIIIIVQENRTPDNLFGYYAPITATGCQPSQQPLAGLDVTNGGPSKNITPPVTVTPVCNAVYAMNSGYDPNHQYEDWTNNYDGGAQDNFCDNNYYAPPGCPPYSYVQPTDVAPYVAIVQNYGFANYMFQTNEGPSFPAHQFLFAGTSSPVAPNDPSGYGWYFVRDNALFLDSGCMISTNPPGWIEPDKTSIYAPTGYSDECYTHDTLVTAASICNGGNCDKPQIQSWKYYTPTNGIIWDAPEALPQVCYGQNATNNDASCSGYEWTTHIVQSSTFKGAPIFADIANCKLAQISWVIPDQNWSDHPFTNYTGNAMGPSWVGDIVNAIGATATSGNCNYWGNGTNTNNVQPTAIFVVWDDWGGFYDHVPPPVVEIGKNVGTKYNPQWQCNYPNSWGCGYIYGFRVPLLVVSEYTAGALQSNGKYAGYVSGACGPGQIVTNCPNTGKIYQHDFGSILAFTEFNFGLPLIAPPGYADNNTIDSYNQNVPLSDFFPLYTGKSSSGRSFVKIPVTYTPDFFQNYYASGNNPTGPDTD
jgi:hypothetical protein